MLKFKVYDKSEIVKFLYAYFLDYTKYTLLQIMITNCGHIGNEIPERENVELKSKWKLNQLACNYSSKKEKSLIFFGLSGDSIGHQNPQ